MQNIAVVGAGFIGQTHIASYKTMENVTVSAVVDANASAAQKAAEEIGCAWYAEVEFRE